MSASLLFPFVQVARHLFVPDRRVSCFIQATSRLGRPRATASRSDGRVSTELLRGVARGSDSGIGMEGIPGVNTNMFVAGVVMPPRLQVAFGHDSVQSIRPDGPGV